MNEDNMEHVTNNGPNYYFRYRLKPAKITRIITIIIIIIVIKDFRLILYNTEICWWIFSGCNSP